MPKTALWKRELGSVARLEYEIQVCMREIIKLHRGKNVLSEKWRIGMIKHWSRRLREYREKYKAMTGQEYDWKNPFWVDLLGVKQGRIIEWAEDLLL